MTKGEIFVIFEGEVLHSIFISIHYNKHQQGLSWGILFARAGRISMLPGWPIHFPGGYFHLMHKKTLLLLATILILVFTLTIHVASVNAQSMDEPASASPVEGNGPDSDAITEPDGIEYTYPPAGPPAFYIINGMWSTRPGQPYHADGSYQFWHWSSLQAGPGVYTFDILDDWVQRQIDAGYKYVGIAINPYVGRYSTPCPKEGEPMTQGVDAIPEYVQKGRDGILGTADDTIIPSEEPDGPPFRSCNEGGIWYIPNYTSPYFIQEYTKFVNALADHLLQAPYRDKIGWVSIGTGKDGENKPVDNIDDDTLLKYISVGDWVDYVKDVMDIYANAFYDGSGFPRIQLTVQNAPFYKYAWERRDVASYAVQKRIGISVNNVTADFDFEQACGSPDPQVNCAGMFDQVMLYNNNVPIQLETYGMMTGTENELYAVMARILHFRADYVRLSGFWTYPGMDTEINRDVVKWATKYLGKGFMPGQEEPPSIWSRMREHRNPVFLNYTKGPLTSNSWPTIGNYEFFLTQRHLPEWGAVTIPVTDDPRITWTGSGSKPEYLEPWHTNQHPFDEKLYNVGLYHINRPEVGVQTVVDPGWVARRTDQASGNVRFIFDAADHYFDQTTPTTYKAIVTVTYLDTGTDKWFLQYDSVTGPKTAMLYAINDWTPQRGLALDGGLPTTGVLDNPVPYVTKTDSGQWKVATFLIEDGNFNNGLFGGSGDLAIDSRDPMTGQSDGDEYIHHVDVQKVTEFKEPVKTGVQGFVYIDANENGKRDPWEQGVPGALVTLDGAYDYQTTTTASGYYELEDVAPGQYVLSVETPAGYENVEPNNIYVMISQNMMLTMDFRHPPLSVLYMPVILTK